MKYAQSSSTVLSLFLTIVVSIYGQQWSGSQILDPEGKVVLFWQNEPDSITMEIQARTPGYVGLGISPSGTMVDADTVIGWVKNGKPILQDGYSADRTRPSRDRIQDYRLVSGHENATHTTIRFSRKLKTGDPEDKDIQAGPMTFIWAYNDVDPVDENNIPYHGNVTRGAAIITLL